MAQLTEAEAQPYVRQFQDHLKKLRPQETWYFQGPATVISDNPVGKCTLCQGPYAGGGYVWLWGRFLLAGGEFAHGALCLDIETCTFRKAVGT